MAIELVNVKLNPANVSDVRVDRGDLSAWDWSVGSFIKDGNYHELDCSAICPEGAKWIHFRVIVTCSAVDKLFTMRAKGNTNQYNNSMVSVSVAGLMHAAEFDILCGEDRVVEYMASSGCTWSRIDVFIRWWE